MDKNKNNIIEQPEFLVAFMDRDLICDQANLITIFKDINKKKLSGVSVADLKLALHALASENDTALHEMMS